jgi:hypothetical protein
VANSQVLCLGLDRHRTGSHNVELKFVIVSHEAEVAMATISKRSEAKRSFDNKAFSLSKRN